MILLNFRKTTTASAAIEFAILLPFMLILLFGAVEVSRYVLVVRKVENATNDIAFLLSREGTIHDINGSGGAPQTGEDTQRIEGIVAAAMPALLYPYNIDNYEIEIRSVARPKNATRSPDVARIMWAHKITKTTGAARPAAVNIGIGSIAASTSTVAGTAQASSIYSDSSGERAELVFPGQTFLVVNLSYGYDQIINNMKSYIALDFEANDIEKLATYAARSRWVDNGDGVIQANEFFNQMQVCTNCNVVDSDNVANACETGAALAAAPSTSGCKFN